MILFDLLAPLVGMALVLAVLLAALVFLWAMRRIMLGCALLEVKLTGRGGEYREDEQLETATRLATGALCGCVATGVVVALGMALGGGW